MYINPYTITLISMVSYPMARPTTYTFSVVLLLAAVGEAAIFTVVNQCPDTVWPASVPVGGGRRLNPGEAWNFSVPAGTTGARVWARTGCSFDASGRGSCQTGDCGGALACTAYGRPPNTLAEFALNQFNNQDFFDISLVDGFNVPMALEPDSSVCAGRGPRCAANITAQCPDALRAPGGCNSACTALKQDVYCCTGSYANNCPQTDYSRFFKNLCPDAYSNPRDDSASTLTCRGGTNYKVTFCPSS